MYRYRNYARLIKFNFARLSAVNLVGYKTALQVNSCSLHRLSGQDFVKTIKLESYSSLLLKQKFKKFGRFLFSVVKRYG